MAVRRRYDAVVVGASLAGTTTAIGLARQGARVALVEKRPDPAAFKRICSHYVQASGVPTLERLGLLEPIIAAGGVRARARIWTPWGLIETAPERAAYGLNLRREVLDPLLRAAAADTPGVELMLGRRATRLLRDGDRFVGASVADRDGEETELVARLVVGADGRDSPVAKLAGVREKVRSHGRFAYGAYFEGAVPESAPDATLWMADPQFVGAFPTDSDLVFYAAMPTKDRLPEFRRDPQRAFVDYIADMPEGPPIREGRMVGELLGKLEMPNRARAVTGPGLALVGDAALAVDPLFGIGCGWAFQSGEWLAESVGPALAGEGSLARGLARYRRLHRLRLGGHAFTINDYSSGRRFQPPERMMFAAAARDPELAARFDRYATRQVGVTKMMATTVPRVAALTARRALAQT
jgi:2-polyprenyl-6-methoxyphenol hydroxylase-like FAD-dependent oxidoreductase